MAAETLPDDYFAVLGVAREPWLEEDAIKTRFHELSVTRHPDAGGSVADFARLNEAVRVLSEPGLRIKHWLALNGVAVARGTVLDAEMQALFMEVGAVLQGVRQWREREQQAKSPLTKALLAPEKRALSEWVAAAREKVAHTEASLLVQLQAGVNWSQQAAELAALGERLTFCAKWLKQLREAQFNLH